MDELHYKISDVAKLYHLNVDTIRYYEKIGLLSPKRQDNEYRYYTISDICALNIIRSLREHGLSLEQIRQHVQHRTLSSTLELVKEETRLINRQIDRLTEAREEVKIRSERIRSAVGEVKNKLIIKTLDSYNCWRHQTPHICEKEVDYYLNDLVAKNDLSIQLLINTPGSGAIIDLAALEAETEQPFCGVFLLSPENATFNDTLAGGEYACYLYEGWYELPSLIYRRIKDELTSLGYFVCADPISLYRVDEHDTNDVREFITEIRFPVKKSRSFQDGP